MRSRVASLDYVYYTVGSSRKMEGGGGGGVRCVT